MASFSIISGNLVDVHQQKIYPATVRIDNGKIISIEPIRQSAVQPVNFILPGFIDSHVHIESSMHAWIAFCCSWYRSRKWPEWPM